MQQPNMYIHMSYVYVTSSIKSQFQLSHESSLHLITMMALKRNVSARLGYPFCHAPLCVC